MNKSFCRPVLFVLLFALLLPLMPGARAAEDSGIDLAELIENEDRRLYVQAMLGWYLRNDDAVRESLEAGYSAVFFFEGCSDNMDDPELSDLSYYRVSAVCLAVRLDSGGMPYLCYFNENCSTLPDRPLEYGAWSLEDVGAVGPATICDGTYELDTVRHGGAYEALHLRTDADDDTVPAVYMTEDGFATARADMINIHTRTGNHTIQGAMWSAGCILVGDGDYGIFAELMESVYYPVYETFSIGQLVGTVTIDRQQLKQELYDLYENQDAVDMLLASSRRLLPENYLKQCSGEEGYEQSQTLWTTKETALMTLPCSNATDPRSVAVATAEKGQELEIVGSICNSAGNLWYQVNWQGRLCYCYSGYTENPGWFSRIIRRIFA